MTRKSVSNARPALAHIQEQISAEEKSFGVVSAEHYQQSNRMGAVERSCIALIILQEQLLIGLDWTLLDAESVTLHGRGAKARENALTSITEQKSSLCLEEGVTLDTYGNRINLTFVDSATMVNFCRNNKLTVKVDSIKQRLNTARSTVTYLSDFLKTFEEII